jgi:GH24 family phage-related lysozyme (muramidase)
MPAAWQLGFFRHIPFSKPHFLKIIPLNRQGDDSKSFRQARLWSITNYCLSLFNTSPRSRKTGAKNGGFPMTAKQTATGNHYSLEVSRLGLEMIVQFEVISEKYYQKHLSGPIWPGGASGVTIGIGYDLGYNDAETIQNDWGEQISEADLDDLLATAGVKGQEAREYLDQVRHINIPLDQAKDVFYSKTLPRYARMTRKAYPGVEELPADAQAMLLSLVFNRGPALEGARRREMKAIKSLVQAGDLPGIAAQIRSMKRLWDIDQLPGLHVRRDREAQLLENARTSYPAGELVRV